jgi:alcohol dehydrogenase (cytochrome c)/quinohemoprotein ethanol dehydrogenase
MLDAFHRLIRAKHRVATVFGVLALITAGAGSAENDHRIENAESEPENWLSYGRTYSEQRYSPLSQIDLRTVGRLGLTWYFDIDEYRPVQATPLVVDGVMYVTAAWSQVYALDAATGKELWRYDPAVAREVEAGDCCRAGNRGVAYWNGKVYVGALDGRLIALDVKTGRPVWQTVTVEPDWPYVINGAPRVVKGKVIIGNSGGDIGVRGYISAYDAETGKQIWRFYTVPGDPAKGFESDAMRMAAQTWTGQWWTFGGGGTVWESIVYDPELDLLYFGTGNGTPWNEHIRSPGGGDNLFTASIVAVRPDTGDYVWHYQIVPGEMWDYDATMPLMLADLVIDGTPRKVLMQAPKDGFFYVLDRETGKLISAEKHVPTNWASSIDLATGRPVQNPAARYPDGKVIRVQPGSAGGHGWYPMAYSPRTGLVYFGSTVNAETYGDDPPDYAFARGTINTGACSACGGEVSNPALPVEKNASSLLAWDPARQRQVWRVAHDRPDGGVLATAGDLVFQGGSDGDFAAYNAMTGQRVWSAPIQNVAVTGPISYGVDGAQYIAIAVGRGFSSMLTEGPVPYPALLPNTNRLLVFKLDGTAALPPIAYVPQRLPAAPPRTQDAATVDQGGHLFNRYCYICHGVDAESDFINPDLRFSTILGDPEAWASVVEDGARKSAGMISFHDLLSPDQAEAIRAFVISRSEVARRVAPVPRAGTPLSQ